MAAQLPGPHAVYTEQDMPEADIFNAEQGTVVVYTSRSPDKTTVNEDAAAIVPVNKHALVLIVADGVGGHPAGAGASTTAIKSLQSAIKSAAKEEKEIREAILSGIEDANRMITNNGAGSATTLAVVETNGREIRTYHVGDSMILIVGQRGKVKLETVSHSPVGYAIESGILTEKDAFHHDERHFVSNVIGSNNMHISIGIATQLAKRDTLLIATDGLFDNLQKEKIVEIIRKGSLAKCSQSLIKLAHKRMRSHEHPFKPDDMTFILFRPHIL